MMEYPMVEEHLMNKQVMEGRTVKYYVVKEDLVEDQEMEEKQKKVHIVDQVVKVQMMEGNVIEDKVTQEHLMKENWEGEKDQVQEHHMGCTVIQFRNIYSQKCTSTGLAPKFEI